MTERGRKLQKIRHAELDEAWRRELIVVDTFTSPFLPAQACLRKQEGVRLQPKADKQGDIRS